MQGNEGSLETVSSSAGQSKKNVRLSDPVNNFSMKSRQPIVSGNFGPVKVVVIDRGKGYVLLILVSILLILTQLSIGAVNIMVLGYALETGDKHAILCTVGWHFFIMESVMSIVYGRAWVNLFYRHRIVTHYILNVCGLICSMIGVILGLTSGIPTKPHGVIGFTAIIITGVTAVVGPLLLLDNKERKIIWIVIHTTFALSAIVLSSVCLILGLLYSVFKQYCGNSIAIVLVVLVSLYTVFIIILTIPKLCLRIKYYFKHR